jgi:hypothetical protein
LASNYSVRQSVAPEVEHEALQRGVSVLYKPVPVEELLRTVMTVSCTTGAA